jgi:hypothetical protein
VSASRLVEKKSNATQNPVESGSFRLRGIMQLKHSYCRLGGVTLGLGIIVCSILGARLTPLVEAFLAQSLTLSVNDGRPVAYAMEILESRHGTVITYEDPLYMHETEIVDHTIPAYKQANLFGRRALSPKGGSLEITYQMSPGPVRLDEMRHVIQRILDAHTERNNPGRFRLQQEGEIFHVIPAQYRDSSGRLVNTGSILDAPISFPEQERSVLKTLELIKNAVSQARGIKIEFGTVPANLLNRTSSRQGATNEKARDVLVRALKATNTKLSWWIFYAPGWKMYTFNVHWVR